MKILTLLADTSNNPIELAIRLGVWIWTNPYVWGLLFASAAFYWITTAGNKDTKLP